MPASSKTPAEPRKLGRRFNWLVAAYQRLRVSGSTLTVLLAGLVGVLAGCGAAVFTWLIELVSHYTIEAALAAAVEERLWLLTLIVIPALGLLVVSWFTRRFAPEAQGHGVPEVITAVARHDGVVRPQVALVKILASGFCIGTGGSIGREGNIFLLRRA